MGNIYYGVNFFQCVVFCFRQEEIYLDSSNDVRRELDVVIFWFLVQSVRVDEVWGCKGDELGFEEIDGSGDVECVVLKVLGWDFVGYEL